MRCGAFAPDHCEVAEVVAVDIALRDCGVVGVFASVVCSLVIVYCVILCILSCLICP